MIYGFDKIWANGQRAEDLVHIVVANAVPLVVISLLGGGATLLLKHDLKSPVRAIIFVILAKNDAGMPSCVRENTGGIAD